MRFVGVAYFETAEAISAFLSQRAIAGCDILSDAFGWWSVPGPGFNHLAPITLACHLQLAQAVAEESNPHRKLRNDNGSDELDF